MRILINGINLGSAGGRAVGRALLRALDGMQSDHEITALVAESSGLAREVEARRIEVVPVVRRGPRLIWRALDDAFRIGGECKRRRADVCFSLGDLGPARLPCPHAVLMHNPWLVYDTASLAARLPLRERLIYCQAYPRRFRRMCAGLGAVTVQTPVVAQRLLERYPIARERVHVIPSACTLRASTKALPVPPAMAGQAENVRLLMLAQFYPHKNHRVLLPVLEELRRRGVLERFHFYLTIGEEHAEARRLLAALQPLARSVTNLGPLAPAEVGAHLAASHALFLPTLLESFGLVYLEAMATGTPILTSERDFSRHVCGDYARYFEPEDTESIAAALVHFAELEPQPGILREAGAARLQTHFRPWEDVARAYLRMLEAIAAR